MLGHGLTSAPGLGGLWSGRTELEAGPAVAWEGWAGTARVSSGLGYPHNQQLYLQEGFRACAFHKREKQRSVSRLELRPHVGLLTCELNLTFHQ